MTETTTPTSSTPLPTLQASRWLLVGGDAWRQALEQALQASGNPMLRWRIEAGLAQLVAPDHMISAAHRALLARTTQLHLYCEPALWSVATHQLSQVLNAVPVVQAKATKIDAPFTALLHALAQPDGMALARWLTGRRHRAPVRVYRPTDGNTQAATGDATFLQRADEALGHWLDGFLEGAEPADLDEIYGPPDLEALTDQGSQANGPRPSELPAAPTRPVAEGWGRGPVKVRAAGAQSTGPALRTVMPLDGRIAGAFITPTRAGTATVGGPDLFSLQWPLDPVTQLPRADAQAEVTVALELDAAAWARRRPSVLALHPAGQLLPILLSLPLASEDPQRLRLRITKSVNMDRNAFVQCSASAAAFRLLGEPLA